MRRTLFSSSIALLGVTALVMIGSAGGAQSKKPALSGTPVFKLHLKPSQEVPAIKNLKANAVGHVTFDLTRNAAGTVTAGEVIFYFNYSFPGPVQVSGLHIHKGDKGANGGIEIGAALSAADSALDADGHGNVTSVVPGDPADLQAILADPRGYYVNLHTSTPSHIGGALRAQLHNPKKG